MVETRNKRKSFYGFVFFCLTQIGSSQRKEGKGGRKDISREEKEGMGPEGIRAGNNQGESIQIDLAGQIELKLISI